MAFEWPPAPKVKSRTTCWNTKTDQKEKSKIFYSWWKLLSDWTKLLNVQPNIDFALSMMPLSIKFVATFQRGNTFAHSTSFSSLQTRTLTLETLSCVLTQKSMHESSSLLLKASQWFLRATVAATPRVQFPEPSTHMSYPKQYKSILNSTDTKMLSLKCLIISPKWLIHSHISLRNLCEEESFGVRTFKVFLLVFHHFVYHSFTLITGLRSLE